MVDIMGLVCTTGGVTIVDLIGATGEWVTMGLDTTVDLVGM